MTDDQLKALRFQRPSRIPISMHILPATWIKYREGLDAVVRKHPILFPNYNGKQRYDEVAVETYHAGDHVDEWGCVWSNVSHGMEAIVTGHPVPTREAVRTLKAPAIVKPELKHGFMYLRLGDLRGFEEIMLDFAEEAPELQQLIDIVLEHNMKKLELMLQKRPEMVYLGDDLGMQKGLAMGADKWRKYLKAPFARIYRRCHDAGTLVYMHTDGCIWEIIPDLIEVGVDVLNPQYRANGLDNLVRTCKGKVCTNLDLDRQMFPFADAKQIDEHIEECVAKLGSREGGLWLFSECAPDVPLQTIAAIATSLEKHSTYWS